MFKKFFFLLVVWICPIEATVYSLGDYAEGGVIFFLTPDREHGLVAAIVDQDDGSGAIWGDDSKIVDAFLDGIFFGEGYESTAGSLNTAQILRGYGAFAEAASLCNEYAVTVGGIAFSDWFLPAQMELRIMFQRKEMINTTAMAQGGVSFAEENYWSSFENLNSPNTAIAISFDPANPGTNTPDKTSHCKVRAIRAF